MAAAAPRVKVAASVFAESDEWNLVMHIVTPAQELRFGFSEANEKKFSEWAALARGDAKLEFYNCTWSFGSRPGALLSAGLTGGVRMEMDSRDACCKSTEGGLSVRCGCDGRGSLARGGDMVVFKGVADRRESGTSWEMHVPWALLGPHYMEALETFRAAGRAFRDESRPCEDLA